MQRVPEHRPRGFFVVKQHQIELKKRPGPGSVRIDYSKRQPVAADAPPRVSTNAVANDVAPDVVERFAPRDDDHWQRHCRRRDRIEGCACRPIETCGDFVAEQCQEGNDGDIADGTNAR